MKSRLGGSPGLLSLQASAIKNKNQENFGRSKHILAGDLYLLLALQPVPLPEELHDGSANSGRPHIRISVAF